MKNEHIDDSILDEVFLFDSASPTGDRVRMVLAHCQECLTCSQVLDRYRATGREIELLKDQPDKRDSVPCPADDLWIKLMAGLVDKTAAQEMLRHASECSACARQLPVFQAYFSDSQEDVAGLESSTQSWQHDVARKMSAYPRLPAGRTARARWFWVPALAVLGAVLVVFFVNGRRPTDVQRLLGQAYGQHRTLELRFSGAQYGPIQVQRIEGGRSLLNESPPLLEAAALISKNLEKDPNSPQWLDAKGRADLLAGHYQAAIESFQRALAIEPESVPFLTDAASAYFERAELADRREDFAESIELLGRALAKKPDDPIALFNRALVSEKMFLFRQAITDWTRYLEIDPNSEWSGEANRHLAFLHQKLGEQKKRSTEPFIEPTVFLDQASRNGEQAITALDMRPEEYLDIAIRKWLPAALPEGTDLEGGPRLSIGARANRLALKALAQVLRTRHGDPWLSDLLETPHSEELARAVRTLADAAEANAAGDFERARNKSRRAARLFRRSNDAAGELRAEFETIYALHLAERGKPCLVGAGLLARQLSARRYPWLQVQLALEQASCWAQVGEFAEAVQCLDGVAAAADKSGYGTLYLRALGIAATLQTGEGNVSAAYALDWQGLARYWSGLYPAMRAYQFYSDLGFPAQRSGRWNFALALEKEAVATIDLTEQRLGKAWAHQRLAKTALMAGAPNLAATEFDRSNHLFAEMRPTEATRTYQASGEIQLAIMESERNNFQQSSLHLARARKLLPRFVHYFIALDFYKALGELERLKGNQKEAQRAQRVAVAISEWGVASLRGEREREVWVHETSQAYKSLAASHWQLHDKEGALRIWELYRSASIRKTLTRRFSSRRRALHLKSSDVDFASLEAEPALPAMPHPLRDFSTLRGKTVVSYMQLSQGLIVWVFDEHRLASNWIPVPSQEMADLVRHFHDECADPRSDLSILQRDAKRLYELLIDPVSAHLSPQGTVVLEPDDTLAELPFSALLDHAGNYLGQVHAIVFSPGLLYQRRLRGETKFSRKLYALAVGSPAISGDPVMTHEPLGDAAEEAQYVASKFEKGTLLTGLRATLSALRRELPRAEVFHFAGHSRVSAERADLLLASPTRPANPVAESIVLDPVTLASINLRQLRLAVLSACSTATKDADKPDISENLVTVFLRARVPHVVASRWDVNSETTADFMRSFYKHLLDHQSVSASLRDAAIDLGRQSATTHPYYWAAFVAYGS